MRQVAALTLLVLSCVATATNANAAPDRDSLLQAWEAYIASLPGTTRFEATGNGTYRLVDADLPYEGEVKIVGALVRPSESTGVDNEFTHLGMVDFELVDLPAERLSSQLYYYWVADRQTLHYSQTQDAWVDAVAFRESFADQYDFSANLSFMTFMMNYGIWVLLAALIVFLFIAVHKQQKKNRALMDETAAINEQARQNVERAASLQDELLALSREGLDIQRESNETLKRMLEALRS